MRLLLVNADDAGLHPDSDAAILRCAESGLVKNATVVVGGPSAERFLRDAPKAGIDTGLHVNLTGGKALAGPASTLTDAEGRFVQPKIEVWNRAVAGRLDPEQVRAEVEAQLNAFRASGLEPSHVDGHNHVHLFPPVRECLADLLPDVWFRTPVEWGCGEDQLPLLGPDLRRWAEERDGPWSRTDAFAGHLFHAEPRVEAFVSALGADARSTEFMVHPGQRPGSPFGEAAEREREVEVLCSKELRVELAARGFEPITFREASARCA
jgi:predicted glycoside hydrolase/deacetylase ChbG (UPF0249 family)